MTIHAKLTPYEFLSQSYYAYFARPIRSAIFLLTFIALLVSLCIFAFDTTAVLIVITLFLLSVIYIWMMYVLFKNSDGTIPMALEVTDKKLVITYGNEESKLSSGTAFKKGSSLWIKGRGLFIIRKPIMAGMLLPKDNGESIVAALQKNGWITGKPAPSMPSTIGLVLFIAFACFAIPFLALYP